MLNIQNERYANGEKFLSGYEMSKLLPALKRQEQYSWLNDSPSASLQYVCVNLYTSFCDFFKHNKGRPKFKTRKKSKPYYQVQNSYFYFDGVYIQIPKLGRVRFKSDYVFPNGLGNTFCDIKIKHENDKWFLSFTMEHENQVLPELTNNSMGIDLGIKELAVVAFGKNQVVIHNINKSTKMREIERKIKIYQRSISRKYLGSYKRTGRFESTKNIERIGRRLKKLYARRRNMRTNYLHQTTRRLVDMLPHKVVMENLNVAGMMKNKHLSKALAEQNFYEFVWQMKYKCEWNGIEFVRADRFYPSSKTCSGCGCIKRDLKLSDRVFICPECGLQIDRDYNAAINLMRYEA